GTGRCLFSCLFFFFSSRRRHTRFSRDWSSDVCLPIYSTSKVLWQAGNVVTSGFGRGEMTGDKEKAPLGRGANLVSSSYFAAFAEIGRASCRERVFVAGGGVSCKDKE